MDNFTKKLKFFIVSLRSQFKYVSGLNSDEAANNRTLADLIRNVHSIEKGLSLANPRLGFGAAKIRQMMKQIEILHKKSCSIYNEAIIMGLDAMREYLRFSDDNDVTSDICEELRNFLPRYSELKSAEKLGGTLDLYKNELNFNIEEGERFFSTRHSIRDFDPSRVSDEVLRKAMKLAQKAPSACNRQGVRAYVLNDNQKKEFITNLAGIGGFADAADRYILVTAKTSAYHLDEVNQYIVSASIYAAYLTMTLHLYGLGSCIIQRPTVWTKSWDADRKRFGISRDEQLICILAVGNLKDHCTVPLSHRLEDDDMGRFL